MHADEIAHLSKQVPKEADVNGKLLIDAEPIRISLGKKRSEKSTNTYRFALLDMTLISRVESAVESAIYAALDDTSVEICFSDGNEVYVTFFGSDYPLLEELDVRVAAAIGAGVGFDAEDVLLYIEDGAGVKHHKDAKRGVKGKKSLINVGEVLEGSLTAKPLGEELRFELASVA